MLKKLRDWLQWKAPKVDLVLETPVKNRFIEGVFQLYGGWKAQKVSRLECDLIKVVPGQDPQFIEPVTTVLMSRTIEPNGYDEFPFQYQLPEQLDIEDGAKYKLQTRLVLENNTKCFDHDELIIQN
ncbi:sporulation protein [Halobacillus fulvus]|nr:sporulation protein [Halobacillus fulvus]